MIELSKVLYTTSATAEGARQGHVRSADGVVDLDVAQPGTSDTPAANPETLFASGYATCFQGALQMRAKEQDIDVSDSTVTATVSFGPDAAGGFGLAVEMNVRIPGQPEDKVRELTELAHEVCPYSKATRGNLQVTLSAG